MKKLGINTVFNIITKLWSMISIYLFTPLYVQLLGETSYGLVSFFSTLQATLNLLGLGLENTLRREFAVGDECEENSRRKYKLLRSIELIYIILGAVIIVFCTFGATFISESWLNIEDLDTKVVANVISLMGISIALQLIAKLYSGCLMGMNKQVKANMLCVGWSMGKSVGALLILFFISPELTYFYSWHILIDLIYLILLRVFVVHELKFAEGVCWRITDLKNLKSIWKYTSGILFISFVSLVNRQLDKVIISKYLTLTELGAYNIATTLGSVTSIIPAALYVSIFPRFTNYATTNGENIMRKEFGQVNKVVNLITACMGAYIAIYALQLIEVWTGSEDYISKLGNVAILIVLAVTMVEFQEIPYALVLAHGNTKYNVIVGAAFIPFVIGLTYVGVKREGLFGAGFVYFIVMFSQTILYQFLVYKNYITSRPIKMIIKDTLLPLNVCLIMAYISKLIVCEMTGNVFLQIIFAILCGGLTLFFTVWIFAKEEVSNFMSILKGGN